MNLSVDATTNPSKQTSADGWGFFDRIYCISLHDRADRREQAQAQFERVGLKSLVEFVLVDKHAIDTEEGIFESHMACLRRALASDVRNVLIFEDDIVFRRFSTRILKRTVDFLASDNNWRLFFLGCFVKSSRRTRFRSIVQIKYRCTAHAYVMRRDFAEKVLQQTWKGIAYDDLLRDIATEHVYAPYPAFAFQSASRTDNDKLIRVDRIRRIFGGLGRLQRWNEFSTRHGPGLFVFHVIFVLAVILFLFSRGRHWFHP